jgi:hypothetical protein
VSRVTDSGHHVSGAVDVDLAYVAERARASARRSREQLERLVAHSRAAEARFGAGSPATAISWRGVVVQAAQTARLRAVAEERALVADAPEPAIAVLGRVGLDELERRVFTIDGIGLVNGRTAVVLLATLLGRDDPVVGGLIAAYLELTDPGSAFYLVDADPLPVAPRDPPDGGGPCYRVGRLR